MEKEKEGFYEYFREMSLIDVKHGPLNGIE